MEQGVGEASAEGSALAPAPFQASVLLVSPQASRIERGLHGTGQSSACQDSGVRAQDAHSDVSVETASTPLSSDLVFLLFRLTVVEPPERFSLSFFSMPL